MGFLSVARAAMRPSVMQWARTGLSARAIQQKLIGLEGHAYRWTDLLSDVRLALGRHTKQAFVERLAPYERPEKKVFVETDLKQPFNYRAIGTATVQDKNTLEFSTRTVSIYTNTAYSPDEMNDYFIDMQGKRSYTQDVDWISFNVQSYDHNRGMAY